MILFFYFSSVVPIPYSFPNILNSRSYLLDWLGAIIVN